MLILADCQAAKNSVSPLQHRELYLISFRKLNHSYRRQVSILMMLERLFKDTFVATGSSAEIVECPC